MFQRRFLGTSLHDGSDRGVKVAFLARLASRQHWVIWLFVDVIDEARFVAEVQAYETSRVEYAIVVVSTCKACCLQGNPILTQGEKSYLLGFPSIFNFAFSLNGVSRSIETPLFRYIRRR